MCVQKIKDRCLCPCKRQELYGYKSRKCEFSADSNKDYVLMDQKDMDQVTTKILKTVTLKNKTVQVKKGKQKKVSLAATLNMDNVKSISYQSNNKKLHL